MELLKKTSDELAELSTNLAWLHGQHLHERVRHGRGGLNVGLREYDPSRDEPTSINRINTMQYVGDGSKRYVDKKLPAKSLLANVVLHIDQKERSYDELFRPMSELKLNLVKGLMGAIEEAAAPMDMFHFYVVGDSEAVDLEELEPEVIKDTTDPERASKEIADICVDGLTFVFSNFYNLRFAKSSETDYSETVAIKVNHGLELSLPANVGKIILPGSDIRVNTKKPKELAEHNAKLTEKHQQIIDDLTSVGAQAVQVAYTGRANQAADFANADTQISRALSKISEL